MSGYNPHRCSNPDCYVHAGETCATGEPLKENCPSFLRAENIRLRAEVFAMESLVKECWAFYRLVHLFCHSPRGKDLRVLFEENGMFQNITNARARLAEIRGER